MRAEDLGLTQADVDSADVVVVRRPDDRYQTLKEPGGETGVYDLQDLTGRARGRRVTRILLVHVCDAEWDACQS